MFCQLQRHIPDIPDSPKLRVNVALFQITHGKSATLLRGHSDPLGRGEGGALHTQTTYNEVNLLQKDAYLCSVGLKFAIYLRSPLAPTPRPLISFRSVAHVPLMRRHFTVAVPSSFLILHQH
jgi:hypothetical protein